MRHLAATSFVLVALLSACGQKGPLVLPDKTKHKTVPAATPAPASTPAPTASPVPAQPKTASPPTPTP